PSGGPAPLTPPRARQAHLARPARLARPVRLAQMARLARLAMVGHWRWAFLYGYIGVEEHLAPSLGHRPARAVRPSTPSTSSSTCREPDGPRAVGRPRGGRVL
ncbi:hypothetical protein, partial [Brachybacterium sp. HMSC06H03]|uniref:hypothetical protein n=1 Tax=Brachybacterium sp. HMSC06H03 TaxID=1581127 RepID=UPI001AEFEA11